MKIGDFVPVATWGWCASMPVSARGSSPNGAELFDDSEEGTLHWPSPQIWPVSWAHLGGVTRDLQEGRLLHPNTG